MKFALNTLPETLINMLQVSHLFISLPHNAMGSTLRTFSSLSFPCVVSKNTLTVLRLLGCRLSKPRATVSPYTRLPLLGRKIKVRMPHSPPRQHRGRSSFLSIYRLNFPLENCRLCVESWVVGRVCYYSVRDGIYVFLLTDIQTVL